MSTHDVKSVMLQFFEIQPSVELTILYQTLNAQQILNV